jgi:hypothetical protein
MSKNNETTSPTFYHHKAIKKFYLDGVIHDEAAIGRLKIEYVRLLISQMRLNGYVPRLDLDPDFTIGYNDNKKIFEFELSIHAVYAGKRNSEWIVGVDGNKPIYTPQSKSKESLKGLV